MQYFFIRSFVINKIRKKKNKKKISLKIQEKTGISSSDGCNESANDRRDVPDELVDHIGGQVTLTVAERPAQLPVHNGQGHEEVRPEATAHAGHAHIVLLDAYQPSVSVPQVTRIAHREVDILLRVLLGLDLPVQAVHVGQEVDVLVLIELALHQRRVALYNLPERAQAQVAAARRRLEHGGVGANLALGHLQLVPQIGQNVILKLVGRYVIDLVLAVQVLEGQAQNGGQHRC